MLRLDEVERPCRILSERSEFIRHSKASIDAPEGVVVRKIEGQKMENALYTTTVKEIRAAAGRYGRVYFGAEFCQWRLPSPSLALRAYEAARSAGLGFTLMTPWLTDAGLRKVGAVLAGLDAGGAKGYEVVVNDLGALSLLRGCPDAVPVLGRLLARQKRCPRVAGMIEGLPEAGREAYLHAGVDDPFTAKLLRGLGVERVELDYPMHGLDVMLGPKRLSGSVYTPFAYVTTTRHCPASFDGEGWQAFTGCRIKGCTKNVIVLANEANGARLLMRGNTQFVENYALPDGLKRYGIDRVVHMEDVP